MEDRSSKQQAVWNHMVFLMRAGLGQAVEFSAARDKFIIHVAHSAAPRLTLRPESNGFIRSDRGGLLFRNASDELIRAIPPELRAKSKPSKKGLEFNWSVLEPNEIRALFFCITSITGTSSQPAATPDELSITADAPDSRETARRIADGDAPRKTERVVGSSFEGVIRELTRPINGQYPRPWMTKLANPRSARVFIVGKNQAKGYPVQAVGSHDAYLDALFNRDGRSCRGLYDKITGGQPSPTRRNVDDLTRRLEHTGTSEILETNVICYSTPLSSHLALPTHTGGRARGKEIFRALLHFVQPSILIADGADTARELAKVLETPLPPPPDRLSAIHVTETAQTTVFVIPSLAPPAYSRWAGWAGDHLDRVARAVASQLGRA